MTSPTLSRAEAEAFLAANPELSAVDAILYDICGLARGKRLPPGDLVKLTEAGMGVPASLALMDVTGECVDAGGRGFSDGDPDAICVPLAGSLALKEPGGAIARVVMTAREEDGTALWFEPRNVLARVVERLAARGLTAVAAFELEFYLLDPARDAQGAPRVAASPRTGLPDEARAVYGFEQLDDFAGPLARIARMAAAEGVPATAATSEYSPGQFEINLAHGPDPLVAADQACALRDLIRRAARLEGLEASFMSKPFTDHAGNGMHAHLSLIDATGANVFAGGGPAGLAPPLSHALGGMMAAMAQSMAIFAPNAPAWRRLVPDQYVPVTRSWGEDNRSVALRLPKGEGASRRIEHRVAAADANPYLTLAAILAGALHGLENEIGAGPPSIGNAGAASDPGLPANFERALESLSAPGPISEALGADYLALYREVKRVELDKLRAVISPLEWSWYL